MRSATRWVVICVVESDMIAPLFALALATLGILVVQALKAWTRRRRARPAT
jgi:hypothetical protein